MLLAYFCDSSNSALLKKFIIFFWVFIKVKPDAELNVYFPPILELNFNADFSFV